MPPTNRCPLCGERGSDEKYVRSHLRAQHAPDAEGENWVKAYAATLSGSASKRRKTAEDARQVTLQLAEFDRRPDKIPRDAAPIQRPDCCPLCKAGPWTDGSFIKHLQNSECRKHAGSAIWRDCYAAYCTAQDTFEKRIIIALRAQITVQCRKRTISKRRTGKSDDEGDAESDSSVIRRGSGHSDSDVSSADRADSEDGDSDNQGHRNTPTSFAYKHECVFCSSRLATDEAYKLHLKKPCAAHVNQPLWFNEYFKLFKVKEPDAVYYTQLGAKNARAYLTQVGRSPHPKPSGVNGDRKLDSPATAKSPAQGSNLKKRPREPSPVRESNVKKCLRQEIDEASNDSPAPNLTALSGCQSLTELLFSSNIMLWYAWYSIELTIQDVRSTIELVMLRPFDSISAMVADQVQQAVGRRSIPADTLAAMKQKWSRDSRFQAALTRMQQQAQSSLSADAHIANLWASSIQRTLITLSDHAVKHAIKQRWQDAESQRFYEWNGDTASLFQRSTSFQQTVIQCLTVHWLHAWQPLFLDLDVHVRYTPSRLEKRMMGLSREYNNDVAPQRVRRITHA